MAPTSPRLGRGAVQHAPPRTPHVGMLSTATHSAVVPRPADTAYWILQPLFAGLLDAGAAVVVLGGSGRATHAWRAGVATLAAGLAAYACCAHDRVKGALAGSDAVNNPVRAAVFRTHASIVKSSIKISVVVLLACVALLPWRAGVMFAVATALGMSYSAPILPGGRSPRSLPFAKGPFCAVVSTVVTILVPAAALGAPAGRTAALVIHTALRSLAYEILQDLPDIEGDAQDGTLTLPVAIGGHASCAVIGALAVACGAAANRAGTTGLHVVPASFLGLVATYVSNPKQYNRVAFKWLSYIPVAVFVSLAVEAVLGTDAFVGRAADPIYFHLF